jgi:hypothetical protein
MTPSDVLAQEEWVLFAVETYPSGLVSGIPVALVAGDELTEPPFEGGTRAGDDFIRRFLSIGAAHTLLVNGRGVGTAMVEGVTSPTCVGLGTRLKVETSAPLPLQWRGLATTRSGESSPIPLSRPLSPVEADTLQALGLKIMSRHDARRPIWSFVATTSAAAVAMPDGGTLLVGTFESALPDTVGVERYASLFLALGVMPSGYSPVAEDVSVSVGANVSRPEVWDVIDVDADGTPEIVLLKLHYESWDFSIMRLSNGVLTEIYEGGGAGC